ncbi:MAG TPA: rhomboid family intramembrane serine protease [Bacteroidales bacterium]|nr:rhomboid family intramembrane serine protease [Bacteroidales bacterium]HQQ43103.1 rhomboid family intramembrane serine protease [Bacteroidales bacterium]
MKKWFPSIFPALFITILMTGFLIFSNSSKISLIHLGIYPLSAKGLLGIVLAPFIHENANHLYSNIIPFFVLTILLFYFYKDIAYEILGFSWIMTGILVWLGARPAYHIGASGVVYALMAFHVLSGMVRKNPRLLAISLLIVFFYGGMIWGIFPDFIPGRAISWESHLAGTITGSILAIYYRKEGPQRPLYSWELEPDEDDEDNEETKQNTPSQNLDKEAEKAEEIMIKYIYKRKNTDEESSG